MVSRKAVRPVERVAETRFLLEKEALRPFKRSFLHPEGFISILTPMVSALHPAVPVLEKFVVEVPVTVFLVFVYAVGCLMCQRTVRV